MECARSLVNWAAECAESLLALSGGNRWLHVQGVVKKAYRIGEAFHTDDQVCLIAAAYLHDIGYAPSLRKTGFHPLDGAYYLRSLGHERLASLVAYHSESRFEASLRGYEPLLDEFPRERSKVADALTYCDMTTDSTGASVSLKERATDVFGRYGATDVVAQALRLAMPYISLAVARTTRKLRESGLIVQANQ